MSLSQTDEVDQSRFNEIRVTDHKLGKGAFGTVWLALGDTGEQLAVKRVMTTGMDFEVDIDKARHEYDLLRKLDHKNIVKVHNFRVNTNAANPHADIVMEYVSGGTIASLIQSFGKLPERAVRNYTSETLQGLQYLHQYDIIHRDLKPANIMVTTDGVVKITDFGLSKRKRAGSATTVAALGTYPYMSPGQMAENLITKQSDIWSVGCTVLEMATSQAPWSNRNLQEQQYVFVIGSAYETGDKPDITTELSEGLKELILCCFDAEKNDYSCEDIMKETFLLTDTTDNDEERLHNITTVIQSQIPTVVTPPTSHTSTFTTSVAPATVVSRVEQPCGDLFRIDEDLEWGILWHRIAQLNQFKASPFVLEFNHLFPLIQYLMCYASSANKEAVHYVDDYRPFEKYFGSAEGMISEVSELNKMKMFELNASTASTENTLKNSECGSMLVRPSKSNRGTLALSVRRNNGNGSLVTNHFFIMPAGAGYSLAGLPGSPVGSTLLHLVNNLSKKFPADFVRGAGRCEIPKITSSVYSSAAGF